MATLDEAVLAYIGAAGKTSAELEERFPGFDIVRLVRAQLITHVPAARAETEAHMLDEEVRFVLTRRGAAAIGIRA
jgi:hypothetical protein